MIAGAGMSVQRSVRRSSRCWHEWIILMRLRWRAQPTQLNFRLRDLDDASLNQAQSWGDQAVWARELELLREVKKIEPKRYRRGTNDANRDNRAHCCACGILLSVWFRYSGVFPPLIRRLWSPLRTVVSGTFRRHRHLSVGATSHELHGLASCVQMPEIELQQRQFSCYTVHIDRCGGLFR